jgi:hypothetical protein
MFFWADTREGKSATLNVHVLGPADPVGTVDHYMIIRDGRTSPNPYQVFVYNDPLSTLFNGTSVPPPNGGCNPTITQMTPRRIDIGQELGGSPASVAETASAATAHFVRNIFAVAPLDANSVFWYNPQSTTGALTSANPPHAQWVSSPGTAGAPEGGDFTTECCK